MRFVTYAALLAMSAACFASCRLTESVDSFTSGNGAGGLGAGGLGDAGATSDAGPDGERGDAQPPDGSAGSAGAGGTGGTGGTGGDAGAGGSPGPCESGTCSSACVDCDGDLTNGCETDITSDSAHCGQCAHSCQGGACAGGSCQPTTLADNLQMPWGVAADETRVYWATESDGKVMSVEVGGGQLVTVASGQQSPVHVVLDDTTVYWANFSGSIMKIGKDGAGLLPLSPATGPRGLALDDSHVFWTNTGDGSIRKVPKGGGVASVYLQGQGDPRGIGVHEGRVYWSNAATGELRSAITSDGTDEVLLVDNQTFPLFIAVNESYIYWSVAGSSYEAGECSAADGAIRRARLDGTGVVTIAESQACPMGMVLDNGTLYWANAGTTTSGVYDQNGSIMRAHLNAEAEQVAPGQIRPYGVAVNSEGIFWTNQGLLAGTGAVVKVAK